MDAMPSEFNRRIFQQWRMDLRESRLKRILELVEAESPGRVLDVACNDGRFASGLRAWGWHVFGADQAWEALRRAGDHLAVAAADLATGLPFRDRSLNLVLAGEIIEHLVDTEGFLRELYRILRPGGALVITTPNLASFENRLKIVLGKYPRWVNYDLSEPGHIRAYTPGALKAQLRKVGFAVEKHVGNWVPFVPQAWMDDVRYPWLAWTGRWFPNLSMAIIIKARRR